MPLAVFCLVVKSTGKLQNYRIPFEPVKASSSFALTHFPIFSGRMACNLASTSPIDQTLKDSGSIKTIRFWTASDWSRGPYATHRLLERPNAVPETLHPLEYRPHNPAESPGRHPFQAAARPERGKRPVCSCPVSISAVFVLKYSAAIRVFFPNISGFWQSGRF